MVRKRSSKLSVQFTKSNRDQLSRQLGELRTLINAGIEVAEGMTHIAKTLADVSPSLTITLSQNLSMNLNYFRQLFERSIDFRVREFSIANSSVPAALLYFDGMVNQDVLREQILRPLMTPAQLRFLQDNQNRIGQLLDIMRQYILPVTLIEISNDIQQITVKLLSGDTLLMVEGCSSLLVIGTRQWEKRPISEPQTETVIRGPREAFTETLADNIVLIRRRVKNIHLKVQDIQIHHANTLVTMVYLDNRVQAGLVDKVLHKLTHIEAEKVLSAGQLEQLMEDSPYSPFSQFQTTERPDILVAALHDGRLALLIDGTPVTLLVPALFPLMLQSPDDYAERTIAASIMRLLRFTSAIIAGFLTPAYVAVTSFNPGMLPTNLVLAIANSREGLPFPSFIEALLMELWLAILLEASTRLPGKISVTVGVVGGIVIGEAVVRANIVGPVMVVVTALTAIAAFAMPSYSMTLSLRIIRISMIFLAAIAGFYGIMIGIVALIIHMTALQSFGESYLGPLFNVKVLQDWSDFLIRLPPRIMGKKLKSLGTDDYQPQEK